MSDDEKWRIAVAERSKAFKPKISADFDWQEAYKIAQDGLNRGDLSYLLMYQMASERLNQNGTL